MQLTWFGHSCFLLEIGPHRLVLDPFFNDNPSSPVRAEEVSCDFLVCSHAHVDHCADALAMAKRNQATIVAPYELANHFAAQGAQIVDLMQGGSFDFPFGRVKLTCAVHSSALELGGGRNLPLGEPCGFIISAEGKKIYHAGDTALFLDMQLIGRGGLDLALLPIGDFYTMGLDDAVSALDFLRPALSLPMHDNTEPKIAADPHAFAARAAVAGHAVKVLSPGESLSC